MPGSRAIVLGCTVTVSHRPEDLSVHVELDDGYEVGSGDRVEIDGGPLTAPFGEVVVERRTARVVRASWWRRRLVQLTGDLGCLELIETSFTDTRTL
ncbi:MAG: hypothetical protein ACK6CU_03065 [Deltaproteobacteria bacterium]